MRTKPDPFQIRDGFLYLEDIDLQELTSHLEGHAVRLISALAVGRVLGQVPGANTISIEHGDPPAILAMMANSGCWARVLSSHELRVATLAGFPPERIVAGGRVKDDAYIRDALSEGVALMEHPDPEERENTARIARALGLTMPVGGEAPPDLPERALANCGGLLAPVLRGPPEIAIDSVWPAFQDAAVYPLRPKDMKASYLEGLSMPNVPGVELPVPAWLYGSIQRGDWVVVLPPEGGGNVDRYIDRQKTHPPVPRILVSGGHWRLLDEREPARSEVPF